MLFRHSQSLTPVEREHLFAEGADLPGTAPLDLVWRPKECQITLYGGQGGAEAPLSSCGLLRLNLELAGEQWWIGGIGGVITAPGARHQGHGGRVVSEAVRIIRDLWQLEAALLFCREALLPFYRRLGFSAHRYPVSILQPAGITPSPVALMVYTFSQRTWPQADLVIDSLPW